VILSDAFSNQSPVTQLNQLHRSSGSGKQNYPEGELDAKEDKYQMIIVMETLWP
jgi:hypothetical protein